MSTENKPEPLVSDDAVKSIAGKAFEHYVQNLDRIKDHGLFALGACSAAELMRDLYEADRAANLKTIADLQAQVEVMKAQMNEAAQDPTGDYYTGLRCGVEDRDITDRYESAEYGWQQAFDYVGSILSTTTPTPTTDGK